MSNMPMPDKFTIIEEPVKEPFKYCPKCSGDAEISETTCRRCGAVLVYYNTEPVRVPRGCTGCGKGFRASSDYFEANPNCPACGEKLEYFDKFTDTAFHTVIDGSWDGVPVGKKIREKNEKLKKMYSGYSHEQKSIEQKVSGMVNEKLKK